MKQRILSMLVSVCMLAGMLPVSSFEEDLQPAVQETAQVIAEAQAEELAPETTIEEPVAEPAAEPPAAELAAVAEAAPAEPATEEPATEQPATEAAPAEAATEEATPEEPATEEPAQNDAAAPEPTESTPAETEVEADSEQVTTFATEPNYLTFTAEAENSSVTLNYNTGTAVKYNKNDTGWLDCPSGTSVALENIDDTVSFRGTNVTTTYQKCFSMTGEIAASGDVTSLTNEVGGNAALENGCYYAMFNICTSLTAAPTLPSTTLANYCYKSMFNGCTGLTAAPPQPARPLRCTITLAADAV